MEYSYKVVIVQDGLGVKQLLAYDFISSMSLQFLEIMG
jgi:hypothetical protein